MFPAACVNIIFNVSVSNFTWNIVTNNACCGNKFLCTFKSHLLYSLGQKN